MLAIVRTLWLLFVGGLAVASLAAACGSAGGQYVQNERRGGEVDRGETNGRRFDFVANKPDDDEWQIRVTGSSMWVSYAKLAASDKLGVISLTEKETRKLWGLIDAVAIPERKRGKRDEDIGYLSLQLKEPGDEELHRVYVSRATKDESVIELALYLRELTKKYKKEEPNF